MIEKMISSPDQRLSELSLLSAEEREEIDAWSCAPAVLPSRMDSPDQPQERGIHGRFKAQVRANPGAPALVPGDGRSALTYRELNSRAARFARHLRSRGVGPEVRVGLLLDDPVERIVAVLGVLKAGGAYVPLDPLLPPARLQEMLILSGAPILVVEQDTPAQAFRSVATIVDIVADSREIAAWSADDLEMHVDGEQLAYVVFTSGSTGRPKGVLVPHRGLLAIAAAWESAYNLGSTPLRHLQAAGFGFDVFAGDWIRALTTGGTLVMCRREEVLDPAALAQLIGREHIECMELVPALAEQLVARLDQTGDRLPALRLLAVGSDMLRADLYRRLRQLVGPEGRVVKP
jgi:non-ribosomal peptide synthetase component F